ncbi:NCA2-domain-containing protein [Cristinia sonorae]|uniref:NCA2-domain-containing protein n=1 Tax=Cristinia sonorae TaxID=1940300 RepID=A0A8K0XSV3_9AGAR|nr:NCA2-domain-containing protein [Cristinia sonorae]
MSTFVSHLNNELSQKLLSPPLSTTPGSPTLNNVTATTSESVSAAAAAETLEALRAYFLQLSPPTTLDAARQCLNDLQAFDTYLNVSFYSSHVVTGAEAEVEETEERALRRAILGKLVVGMYVQALNTLLDEASDADTELEWWGDVARSRRNVALYLLQTLPGRLVDVSRTILQTVRSHGIPLQLSVFSPSSLRRLFPTRNVLRPNTLTVALFPYLRHQPYAATFSHAHAHRVEKKSQTVADSVYWSIRESLQALSAYITYPIDLVHGECTFKRKELEKIRDDRAEKLGGLSALRGMMSKSLLSDDGLESIAYEMRMVLEGGIPPVSPSRSVPEAMTAFAHTTLPTHISSHETHLRTYGLLRPSRLTLLWPKFVFLPPLVLYAVRSAYLSRATMIQLVKDTVDTAKDFWEDWLLAPLKDVVKTVRAGSDDGVIITRESVQADLDSLERMTLALAQDKLGYGPEQMAALSKQIRLGDLTPVMQLYEDDIKNPLRSAVGGTLLRTLFIQVQKAKVDIDQALAGIDKLLKSQELTFAFVGVAPAFAIVYAIGGAAQRLWSGSSGKGRYGGKRRRVRVWLAMRRIERLLIAQPQAGAQQGDRISPLTSGLLLLSVTYLRKYAETRLPANSRLREGFLEDIADLESGELGRAEKMRVVDRMWKSWGGILGWGEAGVMAGGV